MSDNDCTCEGCQRACARSRPGWFAPGEAEKTAELLGMTLPDLFEKRLLVDWWEADEGPTFLLRPATANACPGDESPLDPRGRCVFLTEGRCEIHKAKPSECRALTHGDSLRTLKTRRRRLVRRWSAHQDQITELLGRSPYAEEGSLSPW